MGERKRFAALGLCLCLASLVFSVALQRAGYLTYLNSDMASEVILAKRQFETRSLVQMDWLYSTEVHTVHMNLLYALAFLVTKSYRTARIIGNTAGFIIGMASLYLLLRRVRVSRGGALAVTALLPLAASALYASNMTIGGYYIIHLPFAFGTLALWLGASKEKSGRAQLLGYLALCLLQGFLSVRYVLCFVCPMLVTAVLEETGARGTPKKLSRFAAVTLAGFVCCAAGYAASEVLIPRLFTSGTGAASSFLFNPLDGGQMAAAVMTVLADFLKLLGWRGGVTLFSAAGIVNLLVAAVLFFGGMLCVRIRGNIQDEARRRLLVYAAAAFFVNLFCFVFLKGTYLNRYLILAVLFWIPALPVILSAEENAWLRRGFVALLAVQLLLSAGVLYRETRQQEKDNALRGADAMEAGEWLLAEGYREGYGTFWHIRTLEERTQGQLTFTGVVPVETEEGAVCPVSLDFIRWLEPDDRSDMDHVPGKTFLLLTREEETQLSIWLSFAGAPRIHENGTFAVYGFEDSQTLVNAMLLGRAKLENAVYENGLWRFEAGGRLRVPTSWREQGAYTVRFRTETPPSQGALIRAYRTAAFETVAEQAAAEGENEFSFVMPQDDKYFMLLLTSGDGPLDVRNLRIGK